MASISDLSSANQVAIEAFFNSGNTFGGFSSASYRRLAQAGYKCSEVVSYIIEDIASNGSSIKLDLEEQPQEVQDLMARPDHRQPYKTWMKNQIIYYLLGGSCYAEAVESTGTVFRLPIIRPDHVIKIEGTVFGKTESLKEYQIVRGNVGTFPVDPVTGESDIFESRRLDPLLLNAGYPSLGSGKFSLDQRNEIARLHMQVLKNDGAPAGAFTLQPPTRDKMTAPPTKEQMDKVSDQVNQKWGGPLNRGRVFVLNWLGKFERFGQTGQELDWNESKTVTARELAWALNYPPFLLGFGEGTTFNNFKEARIFLWTNNIIPLVRKIICDLELFLQEQFNDKSIRLPINEKSILAIQELLTQKRKAIREDFGAGIISLEEARAEGEYDEKITGTIFMPQGRIPIGSTIPMLEALGTGTDES